MARIKRAIHKVLFSQKSFELFQRHGINVTRHHFYNPIPDARMLAARRLVGRGIKARGRRSERGKTITDAW